VLYDWMSDNVKDGLNLMRVDLDGHILWKASLPTNELQDCFKSFQLNGKTLTAFTWSCYRLQVDVESGCIITRQFTK